MQRWLLLMSVLFLVPGTSVVATVLHPTIELVLSSVTSSSTTSTATASKFCSIGSFAFELADGYA